jgi:hypothetical protein
MPDLHVAVIPAIVRTAEQPIGEGKADLAFNFDENNKLIRDNVFAEAVERFKREDIRLEKIDLLGDVTPGNPEASRMNSLVEEFRREGFVESDATARKRRVRDDERGALNQGGLLMKNILIFTKKTG